MVLTFLGLFLSVIWLGLCSWYVDRTIGFSQIGYLMPHELGQFLSGVFLPLAFLWVLLSYANLAGRVGALEREQRETGHAAPRSEPSVGQVFPRAAGAGDEQPVPVLRIAADPRGG